MRERQQKRSCRKQNTYHDIVLFPSGENPCGFLIVGQFPNCHPQCDRFIAQTYILPEYRRKGITKEAVLSYIEKNPGKYVLDVIDGNRAAKSFWANVFEEVGYVPLDLEDVPHNPPGVECTTYFWGPKEGEK